jgi:predicted AlkP superfamily phosphohydrolase/phosphomutase
MILVVAWDGADLGLVEPWIAAGELPHLAALVERGATRSLASTRPAVTFPAWTSFLTASSPDRHGIPDFTIRDGYRVRFTNAADRRLPTVFSLMSVAGMRVGTYAVPATYPPDPLSGFQIPGFDTPFGASPASKHGHPVALVEKILARYGTLAVDGPSQARIDDGWHRRALSRMLASIDRRAEIFEGLLREIRPDCAMVHFIESDTVSHQFRHFCDSHSPRYRESEHGDAMLRVYRALDVALGRLIASIDGDSVVMLLSDHGSSATSDRAIFWNRWLADAGRLAFKKQAPIVSVVGTVKRAVTALTPARLHAGLFATLKPVVNRLESAARFAGIDWAHTSVFSEELAYQPSFWLNLRSREPNGTVAEHEASAMLEALQTDLLALRDPFDGFPVVRSTWRREALYQGPFAHRFPDLVVELERPDGCEYAAGSSRAGRERRVFRRLRPHEMTGARGTSMPGAHAHHGLCVVAGPGVVAGRYPTSGLDHAGATLLALTGLAPAEGMNGIAWADCFGRSAFPEPRPVSGGIPPQLSGARYGAAEEALVAERLRALGYIE